MPQKKNPDSLELIRGKAGTIIGKVMQFVCALCCFHIYNKGAGPFLSNKSADCTDLVFCLYSRYECTNVD